MECRQRERGAVPEPGAGGPVAPAILRIRPFRRGVRTSYPTCAGVAPWGSAPICSTRAVRNSAFLNVLNLSPAHQSVARIGMVRGAPIRSSGCGPFGVAAAPRAEGPEDPRSNILASAGATTYPGRRVVPRIQRLPQGARVIPLLTQRLARHGVHGTPVRRRGRPEADRRQGGGRRWPGRIFVIV